METKQTPHLEHLLKLTRDYDKNKLKYTITYIDPFPEKEEVNKNGKHANKPKLV